MGKQRSEQRHHYIPAAYLGRFSWVTTGRLRKRPLYVAHVGVDKIFYRSAEDLAYKEGLYNVSGSETTWLGEHIDAWDYEGRLPQALDELRDSTDSISADAWLQTLVPFITGLFVRSPDRNEGVNNQGRIIEFQELLAPVMAARWTVVHLPPRAELIASDRGFGGMTIGNQVGIIVPCDPQTALVLTHCDKRAIARWTGDRWTADIHDVQVSAATAKLFRRAVAQSACTAVYGSRRELVTESKSNIATISEYPAGIVTDLNCDLQCHTYDYFRACSAISDTPAKAQELAEKISWNAFPDKWNIPVAFQLLFPERTRGGLVVRDHEVTLDLNYGISVMRMRKELGDFRRGAMTAVPIRHAIQHLPSLGEHWQTGRSGVAGHTYMMHMPSGREVQIDLRLLRSDLGLD